MLTNCIVRWNGGRRTSQTRCFLQCCNVPMTCFISSKWELCFQIVKPEHILARIKSRANCQRLRQPEVMPEFAKRPTTFSHDTSLPCGSRGQVVDMMLAQNGLTCCHLRTPGAVGWAPLPPPDSPAFSPGANLGHSNPVRSTLSPLRPLPAGRPARLEWA